jgi:hypothetical protein
MSRLRGAVAGHLARRWGPEPRAVGALDGAWSARLVDQHFAHQSHNVGNVAPFRPLPVKHQVLVQSW